MASSTEAGGYRESHRGGEKAQHYERDFHDPRTTKALLWDLERPLLRELVGGLPIVPRRALDFACGTGRVSELLAGMVDEVVGVDVSKDMLGVARERGAKARFVEADLTRDDAALAGPFDLVTAFRFFLNAEPELRDAALRAIRRRLADDGFLIANFHLNPRSLTGLYIRGRGALKGTGRPMMSLDEARSLLARHGFRVRAVRGYGFLMRRGSRVLVPTLQGAVESTLARLPLPASLAESFIVVAAPEAAAGAGT